MSSLPTTPVVIVHADNWQALYHNGKCVYQQHEVRLQDMHALLPGSTKLEDITECYADGFCSYAEVHGRLPDNLAALQPYNINVRDFGPTTNVEEWGAARAKYKAALDAI